MAEMRSIMEKANRIIRKVVIVLIILSVLVVALTPESRMRFQEITWQAACFYIVAILFVTVLAPLMYPKPQFTGNISKAELLPLKSGWAFFFFWVWLLNAAVHLTFSIRFAIFKQTVDWNLAIGLILSSWVWLLYTNKIPGWRPADFSKQKMTETPAPKQT